MLNHMKLFLIKIPGRKKMKTMASESGVLFWVGDIHPQLSETVSSIAHSDYESK